jgi:hypothetical protein
MKSMKMERGIGGTAAGAAMRPLSASRPAAWLPSRPVVCLALAWAAMVLWLAGGSQAAAATNAGPKVVQRTNALPGLPGKPPGLQVPGGQGSKPPALPPPEVLEKLRQAQGKTNAPVRVASPVAAQPTNSAKGTNAPAAASGGGWNEKFQQVLVSKWFYPGLGGVIALLGVVVFFAFRTGGKKGSEEGSQAVTALVLAKGGGKPGKPVAYHSCNVLRSVGDARQLFHFDVKAGALALDKEQTGFSGEPLPSALVGKEWTSLWQPRLNVALLPSQFVFLRVIQLPKSDYAETVSMVELQLEKLSPMPVAQVVWSLHVLPHGEGELQTVIVIMASRTVAEEFLGQLESQGFLADRLEVPMLDLLEGQSTLEDGAWIYPDPGQEGKMALVAWRNKGVLENLTLLAMPADKKAEGLKEQMIQMAWAGELEGWLSATPVWHLVADAALAAEWLPALQAALESPVQSNLPPAEAQLAAITGRRAAQSGPEGNLLPPEFAVRYQQQFVDRLWMRALAGLAGLYVVIVLVYGAALSVLNYRTQSVEEQVAQTASTYTNAIQMKARYQVLKDRQELTFAALDCYRLVAEQLPADVTLEGFNFSDGKKLVLNGTAPNDKVTDMLKFDAEVRKTAVNGQAFFDPTKGDNLTYRANPNNTAVTWSCSLELIRSEMQ